MKMITKLRTLLFVFTLLFAGTSLTQAQFFDFDVTPASNDVNLFHQTWNSFVVTGTGIRQISLSEAQALLTAFNQGGLDAYIEKIFELGIWDLGSSISGSSDSPSNQVTASTIQSAIFEKVSPASATKGEKATAKITTAFGADAFYGRTEFDGGGSIKTLGTNLSLAWGDAIQFKGTMPIYKQEVGGTDITTYGLDLNTKFKVSDTAALGLHANYLKSDTDFGDSKAFTFGAYGAMAVATGETSKLSFGALLDRVDADSDAYWLGALGANWGFAVGQNSSLNPYVIYYRNFDVPAGDKDWIDLGIEVQTNFTETWALRLGVKTTVGAAGVDKAYQIYVGSAWNF